MNKNASNCKMGIFLKSGGYETKNYVNFIAYYHNQIKSHSRFCRGKPAKNDTVAREKSIIKKLMVYLHI